MATFRLRSLVGASVLALALAGPTLADTLFTPVSPAGFAGMVRAAASEQGAPALAGGKVTVSGQRLVPGQEITLLRGPRALNETPIVVDAEGNFSFELTLDADAAVGLHPILVVAEKPAAATVIELKVSPDVPVSGAEKFAITNAKVTSGLYQVAFSPASGALFVTAAVGRPPVSDSSLVKVDPATLEVLAQATPPAAPARPDGSDGGVFAIYGLGLDDANGNVWITNTRQNTVAVYRQSDLSLVRQFEPGAVQHARDVIVDAATGRVYAGATGTGNIEVFDAATLEKLDPIVLASAKRGEDFSVMSLAIAGGKLVTVSMTTDELAVVDLATGEARVTPLPGARTASGVAYDAEGGLVFVASQNSDNLLIVKAEDGSVLHDVKVGAGALNVTFDPVERLAYVANRGAGTITVVDTAGQIVANLDAGSYPNHLTTDGKGTIWAVNKSRGQDDDAGDRIWHIVPAAD